MKVGLGWLVLSLAGIAYWAPNSDARTHNWAWFGGLWLICVADLYALARTVFVVLAVSVEDNAERRANLSIQALFWGIIKLGCLGLFTLVLIRFGQAIPSLGLLFGVGTLVIVPIVGGYVWSRRS